MKFKNVLLAATYLIGTLLACQPDEGKVAPIDATEPVTEGPEVFPKGAAAGPETQFTVTPQGATFTSADQSVKLIIPAGAVKSTLRFSMQPVENTAPAGSGQAIRLQPHGTQFEKPVTVELSYAAIAGKLSSTALLNIAYQNEKGHWIFAAKPNVDVAAKTISVQATHFSDWVVAETARLAPSEASLQAGEEITLHALQYIDDELLAPLLSGDLLYMHYGKPLDNKYLKSGGGAEAWQLGGDGELSPIANKAVYRSPGRMLEPIDVNVMVELFNQNAPQARHFLVSTIHVSTGAVMSYRINWGMWRHLPNAVVTEVEPNRYGLVSIADPIRVSVTWEGGVGTYRWNSQDEDKPDYVTEGSITDIGLGHFSHAFYETPDGWKNSPGTLKITKLDKVNKIVEGIFTIGKAGVLSGSSGKQIRTEKIDGVFTAKFLSLNDVPK